MHIVLDFETYYDNELSLSRMSTSEYIRHEDFKVHMVGAKVDDAPTIIMAPEAFEAWIKGIDWPNATLVCHHTQFDGFILSQRYGIVPGRYLCTLSMARAALPGLAAYTLGDVASALGVPGKISGALIKTKGVRNLSREQFAEFGLYCTQDVEATYSVFNKLSGHLTSKELKLVDLTVRMFCDPVLRIDLARVDSELHKEVGGKMSSLLLSGVPAANIISNDKFAKVLEGYGVEVPVKVSSHTGRLTYALAKNDTQLKALLHHEDPRVRRAVEARIRLKSSIGETRARRFLEEGKEGAPLPAYLHYYGAHTGRWSGGNKINLQNLPRGGELRKSILAPEDHVLVVVDSGQIEARVTAWYAEETALLNGFSSLSPDSDIDIYTAFASEVYERRITKADKIERFVGKTCILGLGFGMGAHRLRATLLAAQTSVDLPFEQCRRIVNLYRRKYQRIAALWKYMDSVINDMGAGRQGEYKCISWAKNRVLKPSNMLLYYKGLRQEEGKWVFEPGRNMKVNLYGGLLTENIVQGTARDIVADQMLAISERYRVVMMSHDEIVFVAPKDEGQVALDWALKIMATSPSWASDLPLIAEGAYDVCYSK